MESVIEAVERAGFVPQDLDFFYMSRICLGMKVTNCEYAIYARHKPTGLETIVDSGKSQHESMLMAISSLKKLAGEGHIEKNIEDLRDIVSIQGSDGNWNANEYMLGLYNGLVLALATIEGKEPIFKELPGGAGDEHA